MLKVKFITHSVIKPLEDSVNKLLKDISQEFKIVNIDFTWNDEYITVSILYDDNKVSENNEKLKVKLFSHTYTEYHEKDVNEFLEKIGGNFVDIKNQWRNSSFGSLIIYKSNK